MSKFLSPLRVQFLDEWDGHRQLFALTAPLRYQSDTLKRIVDVPAGFVSDGESRPTEGFLTGSQQHKAGVVHDWLYQSHEATKNEADAVYREALTVLGLDPVWVEERYAAVNFWGGSAYASGPQRLRVLPAIALASATQ